MDLNQSNIKRVSFRTVTATQQWTADTDTWDIEQVLEIENQKARMISLEVDLMARKTSNLGASLQGDMGISSIAFYAPYQNGTNNIPTELSINNTNLYSPTSGEAYNDWRRYFRTSQGQIYSNGSEYFKRHGVGVFGTVMDLLNTPIVSGDYYQITMHGTMYLQMKD